VISTCRRYYASAEGGIGGAVLAAASVGVLGSILSDSSDN
jgi:hypothetical protein